jgi:hypothetical protein
MSNVTRHFGRGYLLPEKNHGATGQMTGFTIASKRYYVLK